MERKKQDIYRRIVEAKLFIVRKLVPGSLELFSLKNNGEIYGAIQKGAHDFYIKKPGKELYQTGTVKFTHVWMLEEGE